jgi:hypothetical protein
MPSEVTVAINEVSSLSGSTLPIPDFSSPNSSPITHARRVLATTPVHGEHFFFIPAFRDSDPVPHVSAEDFHDLFTGTYSGRQLYVCDSRYRYEFYGGHIRDAMHVQDPKQF